MQLTIYPANKRGVANHGWLKSFHSFSFAQFYNPKLMNFGLLRVLNDDTVSGGMGFGTHGHDNMEIISIALEGELKHKDSMGTEAIIRQGDVQIMSAGTGIRHSEQNNSSEKEVKFLQIWIIPKNRNISPRYDQRNFSDEALKNKMLTVVAPDKPGEAIYINQDAYLSLGVFDTDSMIEYKIQNSGNGAFVFVLEGEVKIGSHSLGKRDAIGIEDSEIFEIEISKNSTVLLIDVPMAEE